MAEPSRTVGGGTPGRGQLARCSVRLGQPLSRLPVVWSLVGALWLACGSSAALAQALDDPDPAPAPVAAPAPALAPEPGIEAPPDDEGSPEGSLTLPLPRDTAERLYQADRFLERKDYGSAVQVLQPLLETGEDYHLDRGRSQRLKQSIRDRIERLPPDGRAQYELLYGARARKLLEESLTRQDLGKLAELARAYPLTDAAIVATHRLAQIALDEGDPQRAAMLFQSLRSLTLPAARELEPALSMQTALAWHQAGQAEAAVAVLRELLQAPPTRPLLLAGRPIREADLQRDPLELLQQWFGPVPLRQPRPLDAWRQVHGDGARNGVARHATPVGGQRWLVDEVEIGHLDFSPASREAERQVLISLSRDLVREKLEEARGVLPAMSPIVANGLVISRFWHHLTATSLETGEVVWRSVLTDTSLDRLRRVFGENGAGSPASPLKNYLRQRFYRDRTTGALAADLDRVYVVERYPSAGLNFIRTPFNRNLLDSPENEPLNRLVAYSLEGGKLLWELGGPRTRLELPLAGHTFLGPPLVHQGLLYCMTESGGEIRLVVLEPANSSSAVKVVWSQSLATVEPQSPAQLPRSLWGWTPAVDSGVLVCPTGCGLVVAIDLLQRSILWTTQYSNARPPTQQELQMAMLNRMQMVQRGLGEEDQPRWSEFGVTLGDGYALLTTEDEELVCCRLATGEVAWRRPREDALYVATIRAGQFVLVGRGSVMAYRLADGSAAWSEPLAIPIPSGRGVPVDQRLLLPLSTGEIATVDLNDGRLLARSRLRDEVIPGNIVAGAGTLVAQSPLQLVGFTAEPVIRAQIADRLATNAEDPRALALRGELRLHSGEVEAGLADLRLSTKLQPEPYTQAVLAGTLLNLLRSDPARLADAAADLEPLLVTRQQRQEYLLLSARALEQRGDRTGALRQYLKLASVGDRGFPLEQIAPEWSVRADRLLRSRVARLIAEASPADREGLNRMLHEFAAKELISGDRETNLLNFVKLFDGLPATRAAREQLSQVLPATRLPEFELMVLSALDSEDGVLPINSVARSWVTHLIAQGRAGEVPALLDWMQDQLTAGGPYPRVQPLVPADQQPVAPPRAPDEPQTGATPFVSSVATPRPAWQLPLLQHPLVQSVLTQPEPWPAGEVRIKRTSKNEAPVSRNHPVEIVSHIGPFFRGWSFEVDTTGQRLTARDANLVERWRMNLPVEPEVRSGWGTQLAASYQLHICGHWLGLSVVSQFLVLEDSRPGNQPPRLVWQKALQQIDTPRGMGAIFGTTQVMGPNGRRRVMLTDQFNQPLGRLHLVTPSAVVYQVGNKLTAADLASGEPLWTRMAPARVLDLKTDQGIVSALEPEGRCQFLRLSDGELLGSRMVFEPATPQVSLQGRWTLELVREAAPLAKAAESLRLRDALTNTVVWSRSFARTPGVDGKASLVEPGRLAFLESTGRLTLLETATGKTVFESQLNPPQHQPGVFSVSRYRDRYLVLVPRPVPGNANGTLRAYQLDPDHVPFEGDLSAVDATTGSVLWTTPIEATSVHLQQIPQWPVMVFSSRLHGLVLQPNGTQHAFNQVGFQFVDKRTGDLLYSTLESVALSGYDVKPDPAAHEFQVDFGLWNLSMTFGAAAGDAPVSANDAPASPTASSVAPTPATAQPPGVPTKSGP